MTVAAKEVAKIAHLARLALPESKIEQYSKQLSDTLTLVEKINELNTDAVEPMANPMDQTLRLRADEVSEVDQRENLMSNAPAAEAGVFLVPQVIDGGE